MQKTETKIIRIQDPKYSYFVGCTARVFKFRKVTTQCEIGERNGVIYGKCSATDSVFLQGFTKEFELKKGDIASVGFVSQPLELKINAILALLSIAGLELLTFVLFYIGWTDVNFSYRYILMLSVLLGPVLLGVASLSCRVSVFRIQTREGKKLVIPMEKKRSDIADPDNCLDEFLRIFK